MKAWSTGFCLGLLAAALGGRLASAEPTTLVVVAMPANADATMVEALHRLRGEATAVGFDVRLVTWPGESLSQTRIDRLWADLHPAAMVTLVRPRREEQSGPGLDLTFAVQPGGDASVAHINASDVREPERADVILAVRAVDFIRARMFDALIGRRGQLPPAPAASPPQRTLGIHVAAGLALLGGPSGFTPQVAPRLAVGYRPLPWLRLGATGFGFGLEAERTSRYGQVGVDQRFVAAEASILLRRWWRLEPLVSLLGGETWVKARGEASPANIVGQTATRSSPAGAFTLGLALALGHGLACEVYAGTLWLASKVNVQDATGSVPGTLGTVGLPTPFGGATLQADF